MRVEETDLHITYVDTEGSFLKFYAQTDKNGLIVERLLYQLRDLLENNRDLRPKTINDLKVGLLCCTKYHDLNFYRAKILSLNNLQENMVTVCFIDYGNCADVNITDLRLHSVLIPMFTDDRVSKILEFPNLAVEFILGGIASRGEWDNELIEILRNKLSNSNMVCTVCDVGGKKVIHKILKAEKDVASILLKSNTVIEVPFGSFMKKIQETKLLPNQFSVPPPTVVDVTKQPPPTRMPNLTQPPPGKISQQENSRPGSMSGIPGIPVKRPEMPMTAHFPSQSLQFSTEMLAVGVTHPVYVSHVDDGPHSFAVQIQVGLFRLLYLQFKKMYIKYQPTLVIIWNRGQVV